MRVLLVVDVDATIKIYFKRAPFYNALIRPYTWFESNMDDWL